MRNSIYIILLLLLSNLTYAFEPEYAYVVEFTDKLNSRYSISNPKTFLSSRAIERRQKQGISITEQDLPVNKHYVDSISKFGAKFHLTSKWMNSAVYYTSDKELPNKVKDISFVQNTILVYDNHYYSLKSSKVDKLRLIDVSKSNIDYGKATNQITMCSAEVLHSAGFKGDAMHVAVIDAGFFGVDTVMYFKHLYDENRILGTYDFVDNIHNVYASSSHGTLVLSTMVANTPGEIYGTSPDANYYLLRSEDDSSESLVECENWIAAVEFADSAGVDVVNTSLGYSNMDASFLSFGYETMDGKTNRISIASDIAFAKGMIMVNSAGNEGEYKISAPADAINTLTIGAVAPNEIVTDFSSRGPAYDGRVKPDVCGQGSGVYLVNEYGDIFTASGTSFSSPLIAGMVTCLWQSSPDKTNAEVIDAVRKSAYHYYNPTDSLGYGIPNFDVARKILNDSVGIKYGGKVFPNPFLSSINVFLSSEVNEDVSVHIYSASGSEVYRGTYSIDGNYFVIDDLNRLLVGIYILKVKTSKETIIKKLKKEE